MIVYYQWGTKFKTEKNLENSKCENCNHHADKVLMKEIFIVKIFFIPIIYFVKKKGIMCTKCGHMKKLNGTEYRALKNG